MNDKIIIKKKEKVLQAAKKIISINGWNSDIFKNIEVMGLNKNEIIILFPGGYKDLLIFSIKNLNKSLEKKIKNTNIINLPISKRIKKILLTRFEIIESEKKFYQKTFNHLLLPQNLNLLKTMLYKSTDQMWYLAGDDSTDFNFYTKRLMLAIIYSNALIIYNKNGINSVEKNIDKNLKKISKIPKIKERFSFIKENLPIFLKGFVN